MPLAAMAHAESARQSPPCAELMLGDDRRDAVEQAGSTRLPQCAQALVRSPFAPVRRSLLSRSRAPPPLAVLARRRSRRAVPPFWRTTVPCTGTPGTAELTR